jgi:hypothetical protein
MLKFGADPEFFSAVKINNKDYVISPALLEKDCELKVLEQDEQEKHPIYIKEDLFTWMMDGCAWELTIREPLKNSCEMFDVINNSLNTLNNFLEGKKWNNLDLNLYKKPVINIIPDWYIPYLGINKVYQGFIFGCDPDEDAILPNYVCLTQDVATHLFRYGGGHIHISGSDSFEKYPQPAIQLLACTVGNFVIKNSPYPELEKQRATTYGRPGRFRSQKYKNGDVGIEYRTPSNSWCSYTEEKMEDLFTWVETAVLLLESERADVIEKYLEPTICAITNADQSLANSILEDISAKEL